MPFEDTDRKVLHSLTGAAKQVRTPDGTIWAISLPFKTPLNDENLRQWHVNTGQMEPDIIDVQDWVLSELVLVTPEDPPLGARTFATHLGDVVSLIWSIADTLGAKPGAPGNLAELLGGLIKPADPTQPPTDPTQPGQPTLDERMTKLESAVAGIHQVLNQLLGGTQPPAGPA